MDYLVTHASPPGAPGPAEGALWLRLIPCPRCVALWATRRATPTVRGVPASRPWSAGTRPVSCGGANGPPPAGGGPGRGGGVGAHGPCPAAAPTAPRRAAAPLPAMSGAAAPAAGPLTPAASRPPRVGRGPPALPTAVTRPLPLHLLLSSKGDCGFNPHSQ